MLAVRVYSLLLPYVAYMPSIWPIEAQRGRATEPEATQLIGHSHVVHHTDSGPVPSCAGAGVVSNETLFSITSCTCGPGLSQFNEPVFGSRGLVQLIGYVCMMQER